MAGQAEGEGQMSWRDWLPYSGEMDLHKKQIELHIQQADRLVELASAMREIAEAMVKLQARLVEVETILVSHGLATRRDESKETLQ